MPTSSRAEQNASPNAHRRNMEKLGDFRGDNNADHLTELSTYKRHDQPELSARTCKTVDVLLNTDALVLDGEWFYDAVAVEGEDAFTAMDSCTDIAYWGLQVDSDTRMVHYVNHYRPEEMQCHP